MKRTRWPNVAEFRPAAAAPLRANHMAGVCVCRSQCEESQCRIFDSPSWCGSEVLKNLTANAHTEQYDGAVLFVSTRVESPFDVYNSLMTERWSPCPSQRSSEMARVLHACGMFAGVPRQLGLRCPVVSATCGVRKAELMSFYWQKAFK